MSWFSKLGKGLLGGVTGLLTGGPVGAAVGAGGGLLGGGGGGGGQQAGVNWGQIGGDLLGAGAQGGLAYLLSSGDRNKRKEAEKIMMEQMRRKHVMDTELGDSFMKFRSGLTPHMGAAQDKLTGLLNKERVAPNMTGIKPFGGGYTGPLRARTGGGVQ